jgi:hypothetical protein
MVTVTMGGRIKVKAQSGEILTSVKAKRTRHSRDELKELLLETGRTMLKEEGLSSGAEALTFKRVFDRIERDTGTRLTNASVIRRVWDSQFDFQTDVLVAVAKGQSGAEIDIAEAALGPIVASIDLTTLESRDQALRDLCRLAGELNAQAVQESTNWPLLIGVWAQTASGQSTVSSEKIEVALLSAFDGFTARIESIYGAMATFLGLRLREEFTLRDFVVAEDSLSEGYGLRDRLDDKVRKVIVRPTGPDGEEQEWTIFAVALEGLIRQFFEFDPDWAPH